MRTNKKLIPLVIEYVKNNELKSGLCLILSEMVSGDIITNNERWKLERLFDEHRPHNDYWKDDFSWFWQIGLKSPRIRFLNKLLRSMK